MEDGHGGWTWRAATADGHEAGHVGWTRRVDTEGGHGGRTQRAATGADMVPAPGSSRLWSVTFAPLTPRSPPFELGCVSSWKFGRYVSPALVRTSSRVGLGPSLLASSAPGNPRERSQVFPNEGTSPPCHPEPHSRVRSGAQCTVLGGGLEVTTHSGRAGQQHREERRPTVKRPAALKPLNFVVQLWHPVTPLDVKLSHRLDAK